jgi:hypothetical protein
MFQVDEEVEGRPDYRVRARALDVGDKANAARIVFVTGPIEAPLVTWIHPVYPAAETLLERIANHNKSAISL